MTKTELFSKLAEARKVTGKSANKMLNSLNAIIKESLKKEGKARLDGLGTIVVVERKARISVNP